MTSLEYENPELLKELQSFLRILSRELGRRSNDILKIQSGAYSSVTVAGRTPTPEAVDEVLTSLAETVGSAAFAVLVEQSRDVQPSISFSLLEAELEARRKTR